MTGTPAHVGLVPEVMAMETTGADEPLRFIVMALEVTGDGLAQVVSTAVTTSLLESVEDVKVVPVPTLR